MTAERSPMVPPGAELLLGAFLKPGDRESVIGDLLEEYRLVILPERGPWRADLWYWSQFFAFVWRATWLWGALLASAGVFRDTLDWWLAPTQDFYARSLVSTWTAIALFAGSGLASGWRTRSVAAGTMAGFFAGAIAAVLGCAASLGQLAWRHDPHTMAMIAASGGLAEVFVLPFMLIAPGAVIATLGAVFGTTMARFRRPA